MVCHPFVIGELACGNLHNRAETLALLAHLHASPVATDVEVMAFVEARSLMGRGLGWVDVHLLASVFIAGDCALLTFDARLAGSATALGVAAT